jgi:hypothetical protein
MALDQTKNIDVETFPSDDERVSVYLRPLTVEGTGSENPNLTSLTTLLTIDMDGEDSFGHSEIQMESLLKMKPLPYPCGLPFKGASESIRLIGAAQAWLLSRTAHVHDDDEILEGTRDSLMADLDYISDFHAHIANVWFESRKFIRSACDGYINGILVTDHESIAAHPSLSPDRVLEEIRQVAARRATESDPVVHIHMEDPDTMVSAGGVAAMIACKNLPQIRHTIETRRYFEDEASYLVSVIHPEFQRHRNINACLDLTSIEQDVPTEILSDAYLY